MSQYPVEEIGGEPLQTVQTYNIQCFEYPKNEIFKWLLDNIGKCGGRWVYYPATIYFKTEEDKVKFILRWL